MQNFRFLLLILGFTFIFGISANAQVVISEVFGGGGTNLPNAYNADFVELFNVGTTQVDISGYSVQYFTQAATSTSNTITLPAGSIIRGRSYFLIQTNTAATGGTAPSLPTPDYTSPVSVNLNQSQGKILLSSSNAIYNTPCPDSGTLNVVDKVGYGVTATICNETANAPAPSATFSVQRTGADTNNNSTDFAATIAPTPRNSAAPTAAPSSISGRVTEIGGRAIMFAFIKVSGGDLTEPLYARTDRRGFYTVEGLTAGNTYIVEVSSKIYDFPNPSQAVSLTNSAVGVNFVGSR